ncbi:MAG: 16S rRNA (guanine(966)-N(2))-methyltransferase RsmD [Bacteroidales bacterium]|nr:16S rRNA (guanine(966)-N(2))-methyltransferase RsmD [Bacteroidales bacterium]
MRIIAGRLRGKLITPPQQYAARPTTDFAKEGLFNILQNEIDLEQASMLDLFSGTGSISYEAASRGCDDIVAVEMNPKHCAFIKKSASELGIRNMHVVHQNVFDFIGICSKKFDFIFADPPYAIEGLDTIPQRIFEADLLKQSGLLVLEHPSNYNFESHARFVKEKKYGNVHFSFFK